MTPTWQTPDGAVKLWLGDCREILPHIPAASVGAVITDPPYGIGNDCDYTRFSNGLAPNHHRHQGIYGDDEDFDPTPWIEFPKVVLFGYQYFSQRLPAGTVLVWNKKAANQLGTFLSDCELAWMKGGIGTYLFQHIWHGFDRETERGEPVLHPSQKPVAVMTWVMDKAKVCVGERVLDPFMGSGACGIACIRTGRTYDGIEREPKYFEIAKQRIIAEIERFPLFEKQEKETQRTLITE